MVGRGCGFVGGWLAGFVVSCAFCLLAGWRVGCCRRLSGFWGGCSCRAAVAVGLLSEVVCGVVVSSEALPAGGSVWLVVVMLPVRGWSWWSGLVGKKSLYY